MDPDTTLRELREHVRLVNDPSTSRATRATHAEWAVEKFEVLDAWLSSGGFSPSPWNEAQRRALENTPRVNDTVSENTEYVARAKPVTSGGVAPPAQRTRPTTCEKSTLAGTTIPAPCPPEHRDPFVNEVELGARDMPPSMEDEARAELERRGDA